MDRKDNDDDYDYDDHDSINTDTNTGSINDEFMITFMHDRIRYKTLCTAFKRQRGCRVVPVQWVGEYYDLLAIRDIPEHGEDGRRGRVDSVDREESGINDSNNIEPILSGASSSSVLRSPICLLRINDDEAIENAVRYYHDRWIWLSMLMFGINPCGNHCDPNNVADTAGQNYEDSAEIVSEPIRQDASARREREFLLRFFEQDLLLRSNNTVANTAESVDTQHRAENSVALAVCRRLTKSNEIMARRLYSDFSRLATDDLP